ncbi:MAG: dTDP-4-dehydrorhamnose reductase [Eubacterium sp.]|nr:dTDP-4-dehydrorhamnose reductase [Eubacterium sp.]
MKVFVTGVKGQLGYDVVNELNKRGHEAVGVDIDELDITKEQDVHAMLDEVKPNGVIHCAAWTAVDDAEDNYDKVMEVNAKGTEYIAKACKKLDVPMIYISTDYVFNGEGTTPWKPDDKREPLNVYGKSKYLGELAVEENLKKYYIVRIAWVFGQNGHNFINTMLNLGKTHDKLTVVDDQIGTPTYTYDLARLLVDMIEIDKYGTYHVTNEGGYISWYEFTVEIMKRAGEYNNTYKKVEVSPVGSDAYPAKAKRPSNSRMDKSKLIDSGFKPLPDWKDALSRYLSEKLG